MAYGEEKRREENRHKGRKLWALVVNKPRRAKCRKHRVENTFKFSGEDSDCPRSSTSALLYNLKTALMRFCL